MSFLEAANMGEEEEQREGVASPPVLNPENGDQVVPQEDPGTMQIVRY